MSIIKFITKKEFNRDSPLSPDNYYLNECVEILDNIFNDMKCELKEIDGGGGGCQGGCQGGGYVWVAFEYLENKRKMSFRDLTDLFLMLRNKALSIKQVYSDHVSNN